jgi:hypothetical protein
MQEIKELGTAGYGTNPNVLKLRASGAESRAVRERLKDELLANFPKEEQNELIQGYRTYSRGAELRAMLEKSGVVKDSGTAGTKFDMGKLAQYLKKNASTVEQYLGKDALDKLVNVATRGAGLGFADEPRSALKSLIYNRYAGSRLPFEAPTGAKVAADVLAAKNPRETATAGLVGGSALWQLLKGVPSWVERRAL